ncbi:16S rRNA (guanine(966)-N(2))-methyltransferase RsmD [Gammaproteobacteria bacterium 42_54_T18]|nr:16S rRNA (guanine(966)-N(2))-methyltransferase RsmD [Gammaproteobacteria bacterium 42_54_T18]
MPRKRQPLKNNTVNTSKNSHHQLRIIGGQWRSRKLSFTAIEGLRPTQDRVRETLFNWLTYDVEGVNCLDVFAGSGALGLEALSRGAKHVQFIEKSQTAAKQINQHLMSLNCSRGNVKNADALQYLSMPADNAFNVIFLDPPFNQDLLVPCCELLIQQGYCQTNTFIYVEAEPDVDLSKLPKQWHVVKDKSQPSKHIVLYQQQ